MRLTILNVLHNHLEIKSVYSIIVVIKNSSLYNVNYHQMNIFDLSNRFSYLGR